MPAEFFISVRVYYDDTDAAGVVYHSNYLKYMERARTDWLRQAGFAQRELASEALFVVRRADVRFQRPARLDDMLEVSVHLAESGGARLEFVQDIRRKGVVLCDADIQVACLDPRNMKPVAVPPAIAARLPTGGQRP